LSAALMPAAMFVVPAPIAVAILCYSLVLFGHQAFSANVQTLAADLFPSRLVGSVAGLMGAAGALGGALFSEMAGRLVQHNGYTIPFILAGVLHPTAFLVILLIVRKIEPIRT
jgi:MFS transporter, ACS family, hexuronate transporter